MTSTNTPERRIDFESWAPRICAMAAFVLCLPFLVGSTNFCLDDAWIHLSYARSLRLGEGLSYNPGDWETGVSSPLWVLLLSLWPSGADPVLPIKLLGILLHAATAHASASVAVSLGRQRAPTCGPPPRPAVALLAGTLVASNPTLLQGATSGMEVPLAALLIVGTVLASLRGSWIVAALLAGLALLARPEAALFTIPLALAFAATRRQLRPLSIVVGSLASMAMWIIYCLVVSGWPWPNTRYVKATGGGVEGLGYLADEVLVAQPWLVGIGGVILIGLALREDMGRSTQRGRRLDLTALLLAWMIALVGVALSRPLHPGVLFYESRYFAIFAPIPAIAVALGVAHIQRRFVWVAWLLVVPIALMTGLQTTQTLARVRAQEADITLLHSLPAKYAAQALPPESVLAVEGAGAMRFFTPRTMTIVDILGLNDRELAHGGDTRRRACLLIRRRPNYFALPHHMAPSLANVFVFESVAEFPNPSYAQVRQPHRQDLLILKVVGVRTQWQRRCDDLAPGWL